MTQFANEGDGWAGSGANPWHLDDNTESILFLTDEGDKPVRIGFSVTVAAMSSSPTSPVGTPALQMPSSPTGGEMLPKLPSAGRSILGAHFTACFTLPFRRRLKKYPPRG